MRKKGKKVIRPAGDELMDYLNRGFAICNRCGAVMDQREDPRGGCDIYACPSCGWEIDEMEYEYESGDPMELVQDERRLPGLPERHAARRVQSVRRPIPLLQAVVQNVRRLSMTNVEEEPCNRGFSSFIFLIGAEMAECIMRNYFEEEPVMDITKKVAALRFKYHANMLDVCNVLNQISILKDEKAESVMKNHTMQCFDCLERLGYPIEKFLKEQEKES